MKLQQSGRLMHIMRCKFTSSTGST